MFEQFWLLYEDLYNYSNSHPQNTPIIWSILTS